MMMLFTGETKEQINITNHILCIPVVNPLIATVGTLKCIFKFYIRLCSKKFYLSDHGNLILLAETMLQFLVNVHRSKTKKLWMNLLLLSYDLTELSYDLTESWPSKIGQLLRSSGFNSIVSVEIL